MTREHFYLHRGKRLNNGQWVYGNLLAPAAGEVNAYYIKPGLSGRRVAVEPSSVGEYTGLNDTQGNKIFEGDILKLTDTRRDGVNTWYAIVEFGNPNGLYSWGWQLRRVLGVNDINPDILLWLGEGVEESGIKSRVVSKQDVMKDAGL